MSGDEYKPQVGQENFYKDFQEKIVPHLKITDLRDKLKDEVPDVDVLAKHGKAHLLRWGI